MATSIMAITFQELGIDVSYILPNRLTNGYGMKNDLIDEAKKRGAEVIITVDNGISANEAVNYAKSLGMTVIITDHHLPGEELPNADLVIDPHVENEGFSDICGAMVAFKLCYALLEDYNQNFNYDYSELYEELAGMATIATIGDMMPIIDENRYVVKYALKLFNVLKQRKTYNRLLKIISGFGPSDIVSNQNKLITEETISFFISPTINSQSRVYGDATKIVDDIISCDQYGKYIKNYWQVNNIRKERTRLISSEHKEDKNSSVNVEIIDVNHFDFPINGMVGLIANKTLNAEKKPTFIGSLVDGTYKLSGRSIPGYSLHEVIRKIQEAHPDVIKSFGGHDVALGVEIETMDKVEEFKQLLEEDFKETSITYKDEAYRFNEDLYDEIIKVHKKFAPYGEGFKKLKFYYCGPINEIYQQDNSLMIGNYVFKSYTSLANLPEEGSHVEVIFTPSFDYSGYVDFKILDIQKAD